MKLDSEKQYITILMTSPDRDEAEEIARRLLEEHRVACVSIWPKGNSYFWWKGEIAIEEEFLIIAKTRNESLSGIIDCVKNIHKYVIPEIIALPIVGGNQEYLDWLQDETNE